MAISMFRLGRQASPFSLSAKDRDRFEGHYCVVFKASSTAHHSSFRYGLECRGVISFMTSYNRAIAPDYSELSCHQE